MNTPSHAIINPAVLGSDPKSTFWAAFAGSIIPDVPLFGFYFYHRFWRGISEADVWDKEFFTTSTAPWTNALHSFPLIALALTAAYAAKARDWVKVFLWSMFLHDIEDFFLHHDDAHRQLWPLSGWRFLSPVSYWDLKYHGTAGAAFEMACVLAALFVLAQRHEERTPRLAFTSLAGFYVGTYSLIYLLS